MILITGPAYAGKRDYVRSHWGLDPEALDRRAVWKVEAGLRSSGRLSEKDMEELAEDLAEKYDFVILRECGSGVIPMEQDERDWREAAGRLSCCLAGRAQEVHRVVCGIGQRLK